MKQRLYLAIATWLLSTCVVAAPLILTEEEQAWIAANPVVRMAVDPNWKPVEYMEDGRYLGLASEYVAAVERKTGLHFKAVYLGGWGTVTDELSDRKIDVLPAVLRAFTSPPIAQHVTFTNNYFVGSTIVITKGEAAVTYDLSQLRGKVVALKGGGAFQAKIQAMAPNVRILATKSPEEALLAVVEGRADAALDASQTMLPFLRRKYQGVLYVSGMIGSMPMELAMGVRNDLPLLSSIINKVLLSLTATETDGMILRWRQETDYGAPSFSVLIRYYGPEFALMLASLLLVCGFALHARKERRRAQRSEKEKTMFLAVMSHEIRSPMNAILASMELLQRNELPAEPRRLIHLASSGAENLLRLVDDVLDVSKLDAGRVELEIAPLDVMELVHSVIDQLSYKAQEKGIALMIDEDGTITRRIMADRLRIGQILHNLLSNAIKFTAQGSVSVVVRYEAPPGPSHKGMLHLGVVDTGIGMDLEARKRLFDPYAQGAVSTARKFGGTGLGLPICRELVELMQGVIKIDSAPGKGTRIEVHLPCKLHTSTVSGRFEPILATTRNLRATAGPRAIRVLLIEDTPANQAVLQAQLDVLGCTTVLAEDGATGLKYLETGTYDIVLMDCNLPDISGYDVTRRWREQEQRLSRIPTPILAISASTDSGHTAQCFEAGMDGVLKKPIKLGKLRDALQLWSEVALNDATAEPEPVMDHQALVRSLEDDADALRTAWLEKDRSLAVHFSHRLVGAAQVLGAQALADEARVLEALFKQASEDDMPTFDATQLSSLEARLREWAAQGFVL